MELPFDKYTYQARLAPVFIVLVPLSFAVTVWLPTVSAVWNYATTLVISFGLTALLAQLGRELGKSKQNLLYRKWGGKPSTRMLSHRNSRLNQLTLDRYHHKLALLLPETPVPSRSDEHDDPPAADRIYDSCVHFLLENTRDRQRFPLVFAENVNYGFRRNLWGLKPIAISTTTCGIMSCGVFLYKHLHDFSEAESFGVVGLFVSLGLLLLFLFVFKPNWVRLTAEAYAERLLGSIDGLK